MANVEHDPFDEMIKELSNPSSKMTFDVGHDEEDLFETTKEDKEEEVKEEEVEETTDEVEETEEETETEEEEEKPEPPKKETGKKSTKVEKEETNELGEYESDIAKFVSAKLSEKLGEDLGDFDKVDDIIDKLAEIVEESSIPEFADEEIAKLDKFVRDGGKLRDFYSELVDNRVNVADLDMEDVSDQKKIIKESLKNAGYTDVQIKRKLERYEEAEALQEEAEEALELVKEFNSKNEKKLLKD